MERSTFYRQLLSIALPITLQNLIQSSLNTVDTVMIGHLGETAIAGVGLANQFFFIYLMLLFGINSGASIFHAQFHGKRDSASIRKVLGYAMRWGLLLSAPFVVLGLFFPGMVIRWFVDSAEVVAIGQSYLRIITGSILITALSFSYSSAFRSIGLSKVPMAISFFTLGLNTVLNYILIFGVFGIPAMGVAGAAWATLFSRVIELIAYIGIVHLRYPEIEVGIKDLFVIEKKLADRIWHTMLPVILNEFLWGSGVSVYLVAYGTLGPEALAAYQISNTVLRLFFVLNIGIANACQVMLGHQLGGDELEGAVLSGRRFVLLGIAVGFFSGLLMAFVGPLTLPLFKVSAAVAEATKYTLWGLGAMLVPKTVSAIYIVGILRGGGDTRYALLLEIVNVYLIGIPLSFFAATVLHLPIYWVVFLTNFEEVSKTLVGTHRFLSNKWARNVVSGL